MILTLLNVDWRIVLMYNCFGVLTVKKTYNKTPLKNTYKIPYKRFIS